jgi:hypothetical protein
MPDSLEVGSGQYTSGFLNDIPGLVAKLRSDTGIVTLTAEHIAKTSNVDIDEFHTRLCER